MRVSRRASAATLQLVASRVDHDGVFEGSCATNQFLLRIDDIYLLHTSAIRRQGPHIEDINALHLSEDFETFETSGLLEIGRNGTGSGTGGQQIRLSLDFCIAMLSVAVNQAAHCSFGMHPDKNVPSKASIFPPCSPGLGSSLSAPVDFVSYCIMGLEM